MTMWSNGRVYLPAAWLREAGATLMAGQALSPAARQAVVPVVGRLLDEADRYYASAGHGVPALPWRSAWSVATARHVYADIGDVVRRRGALAWDSRAATGRGRKVGRLVLALGEAVWSVTRRHAARPPRRGLWTPASAAVGESTS